MSDIASPNNDTISVSSGAEHNDVSGLIVVQVVSGAICSDKASLHIRRGADEVFVKSLPSGSADSNFWLALHGHLLPNGPVELEFEVWADGQLLTRTSLVLRVRNEGTLAEQVKSSLIRRGVPLVLDGICDSGQYDYEDATLMAWFDCDELTVEAHLSELLDSGRATENECEALRHFVREGFIILPDVLLKEHLNQLNMALDDAVARKVEGYEWGSSQRIHNLHDEYPAVRELWLHPVIMRMLNLIFDGRALPCQSLTYLFGSQQDQHQDTIHLTPFPAGRMCGVWTALEDVQPDSGELVVFPQTHRLPRVYMKSVGLPKVNGDWSSFTKVVDYWNQLIKGGDFSPMVYRPRAGTVLIWHENLMHAGSRRLDLSKSRRSVVGHYFAQGAIAYYDSTGMPGGVYEGTRS